jgi:hypothetical protein
MARTFILIKISVQTSGMLKVFVNINEIIVVIAKL